MNRYDITHIATNTPMPSVYGMTADVVDPHFQPPDYLITVVDATAEWTALQQENSDLQDMLANGLLWLDANIGNATTQVQALQELKNIRAFLKRLIKKLSRLK